MKTALFLILLSLSLSALGQGVFLRPGDSFSYQFSALTYAGDVSGSGPRANFTAYFASDLLDPGESVRLEIFEDSLTANPIALREITAAATPQSKAELFVTTLPLPWQDLQGAVRLTMLSGSANLDSIGMYTQLNTSLYSVYTPVPEPSALPLLGLGLLALAVRIAPSYNRR